MNVFPDRGCARERDGLAGGIPGTTRSKRSSKAPQFFVRMLHLSSAARMTMGLIMGLLTDEYGRSGEKRQEQHAVRTAAPSDAEAVAGLLTQLGYHASKVEAAERLALLAGHPGAHVLVADSPQGVVGVVSFQVIPMLAEGGSFARITALAVDRTQWRKGVGSLLLAAAGHAARNAGCTLVEVSSGHRPERDAAHAFYRAHGYHDTAHRSTRYWKRLDGQR